jgi:DNA modification methylase
VTSPPYYGLRNYENEEKQIGNENSHFDYVDVIVSVFEEIKRILKDDGVLWLNLGDSYYNYRPGKGQALCKQTISKTKQDLPDSCNRRANKLDGLKEKDLIGIPWRVAFALQENGWFLRNDIVWHKVNCQPESVKDRFNKKHEYLFMFSKKQNYYFDKSKLNIEGSVWSVNVESDKFHHAIFPKKLIEPCVISSCPENGVVIDPFFGTGTVGVVCVENKRNFVGIELTEKSYNRAIEKVKNAILNKKNEKGMQKFFK